MKTITAAGVAAACLLASCGSDSDSESAGQIHVVTASDFAYDGLPETIAAGDRLELENDSPSELHELVAFRLADDDTRSIEELVGLPPEELLGLVGPEPATVLLAAPDGEMIAAVGDGTLTEPGRYGAICVIPTGADPAEYLAASAESDGPPDVAGGPPHIANGMYAEFIVDG